MSQRLSDEELARISSRYREEPWAPVLQHTVHEALARGAERDDLEKRLKACGVTGWQKYQEAIAERDQATAYAAAARGVLEECHGTFESYDGNPWKWHDWDAPTLVRRILSSPTPPPVAEHLQRVEALERVMERVRHLAKDWSRLGIPEMAGTLKDIVNEHDQAVVRAAVVATEPTERGAGEESK